MRAFSVDNILFRDSHGMPISTESALASPESVVQAGTCYDIQKNRRNGQVLWYHKDILNPDYCPVMRALSLVRRAVQLGQLPSDPLCVYIENDKRVYLTDKVVTEYYRTVTKRVHPTITEEMLSLISTHSIRVTACILLAEAGKPMYFIKLRLRWLSNWIEIYLRNTDRVAMQHLYAITPGTTAQATVTKVPLVRENIDSDIVKEFGNVTLGDYEFDDEDEHTFTKSRFKSNFTISTYYPFIFLFSFLFFVLFLFSFSFLFFFFFLHAFVGTFGHHWH
jgi:hypothetical protein